MLRPERSQRLVAETTGNRCEDTNTQMSVRSKCRGASTARAKLQVMQHAGRRMEKVPARPRQPDARAMPLEDRNSQLALDLRDTTADRRRRSEEHTSELQSLMRISY